jgi:hypothetical protein
VAAVEEFGVEVDPWKPLGQQIMVGKDDRDGAFIGLSDEFCEFFDSVLIE